MEFITKSDLKIKNGTYLVNSKDEPVNHSQFVKAQQDANYLILLSKEVKDKDFQGKKPENFDKIVKDLSLKINNKSIVKYKTLEEAPVNQLINSLKLEATAWINNQSKNEKITKINKLMQKFNIINEFEEIGLYFSKDIIKLNQIYSIEEILEAITILEPHLNA